MRKLWQQTQGHLLCKNSQNDQFQNLEKYSELATLQYFANSDNDIFAKQAVFNNDEKSDNTKHISHCLECCPKIPLTHS